MWRGCRRASRGCWWVQINVIEYLENGAARHCPEKTAIIEGGRCWAFAELHACACRCAALLIQRADVLRQVVAVYLPKGAGTIIAALGIVASGNIYANLDVRSPGQRTRGILANVDPVLVVTSRDLAASLAALSVPAERLVLIEDVLESNIEVNAELLRRRRERVIDTDPLCIIHTSGSTGI